MSVPVCVCVRVNMHQVVVQWGPGKELGESKSILHTYIYVCIFIYILVPYSDSMLL